MDVGFHRHLDRIDPEQRERRRTGEHGRSLGRAPEQLWTKP